jgi:hypothetical protein
MNKEQCLKLYDLLKEKDIKPDIRKILRDFLKPPDNIFIKIYGKNRSYRNRFNYIRQYFNFKETIERCHKSKDKDCIHWVLQLLPIEINYSELIIEMKYLDEYKRLNDYDAKIRSFYNERQRWWEDGLHKGFVNINQNMHFN